MPLFSLRTPPTAFGLDLSDTAVKIAQLRRSGRAFVVESLTEIVVPTGLIKNGEIQNAEQLAVELTKRLVPHQKTLVEGVVVALPESKTFIQTITIAKKEGSTFDQQLLESLPEYLPLPLEEMYQDSAVVNEDNKEWQVITGAAPKALVDSYIQMIESMHLIPIVLDIQAMAIARTVIPAKETQPRTRAIIDLGRHRTSFILHDQGAVQFTMNLPIAGDQITENIAKELNLSIEQAEKAKTICGLDPVKCEGILRTILEEMVENLIKRITEAREFYQNHFPKAHDLDELVLTGGGAHLTYLDQVLTDVLKVPVRMGNLWENAKVTSSPKLNAPLQYSTVIGLALRGAEGVEEGLLL